MWRKYLVAWLLLLIPADSCSIADYLTRIIEQGRASKSELAYAKTLGLPAYFESQLMVNARGSAFWLSSKLNLAKKSGTHAVSLAQFYYSSKLYEDAYKWFRYATTLDPESREFRQLFSEFLYQQSRYQELTQSVSNEETNSKVLNYLLNAYLALGDLQGLNQLLSTVNNPLWKVKARKRLEYYQVFPSTDRPLASCDNSIQMFATNIEDLGRAEELISLVQSKAVAQYFCFEKVRYTALPSLNCRLNAETAIQCDELAWQKIAPNISARYVGVILPEGGANVHEGILYLDRFDTEDVFAHEIWHLLGFVDEYPLPEYHSDCQQSEMVTIAKNVFVTPKITFINRLEARAKILSEIPWAAKIKPSTPILTENGENWHVGTPSTHRDEIGVFPAKTCSKSTVFSFKPVNEYTTLEYQETPVPRLYHWLLENDFNAFIKPSYHFNIALASEQSGNRELAHHWLRKTKFKVSAQLN